jgi:glycosyltransferase involved in cell wall biosynthesis
VHLHEAVPYEQVLAHTATADLGLVSVKPTCLSYLYCLPNKLFEYIQAGIPVLTNDLPDCAHLVASYVIGGVVSEDSPAGWADAIRDLRGRRSGFQPGLKAASLQLHWQKEAPKLLQAHGMADSATD